MLGLQRRKATANRNHWHTKGLGLLVLLAIDKLD